MDGSLDDLLAASPSLAAALPGIRRAAHSMAPMLLLGEAGTGRSALARAVHAAGERSSAPLVDVDLGLLPTSLVEGELFGHSAGAFTGAVAGSLGRVARAEGGTLVLDRVEALPLESQPKLLRLLAESRYAPLGDHDRDADVRFVAIGPVDLPRRVERGLFRADLFYRLEVLAFRVPALRARLGDLPTLASSLLADLAERLGRPCPRLGPGALAWMGEHPWPGNLRELRNVLERALITDPGELLEPPPPKGMGQKPRTLREVEAEQIRVALAHTRGHQGRAAELLGISRKALWQKRKRLDIP